MFQIFDKSASFSVFGGGDGLHVPPFGKSGEDSTGFSNGECPVNKLQMTFNENFKKDFYNLKVLDLYKCLASQMSCVAGILTKSTTNWDVRHGNG